MAGRAEVVVLDQNGSGLSEAAGSHDIVVLGAPSDRDREQEFAVGPDGVVLRSGRPVLVVPQGHALPAICGTAVVA